MQRIAKVQQVSISKLLSHYKEPVSNVSWIDLPILLLFKLLQFVVFELLNEKQQYSATGEQYGILQQVCVTTFYIGMCKVLWCIHSEIAIVHDIHIKLAITVKSSAH